MNKENLKSCMNDMCPFFEHGFGKYNCIYCNTKLDHVKYVELCKKHIVEKPQSALNEIMKLCEINLKTLDKLWRDSISEYKRKGYPEGEKDFGMGVGYGESWHLLNEILQKIKKELER